MALVEIRGVAKSYGGVQALRPLDLNIQAGEVLAICGENGAGKSTLNKILSGTIAPDSGSIAVGGRELVLGSVTQAEEAGIAIVHQESAAFLHLTATENHQMMHEPGDWWLDREEMRRRTVGALQMVGESFDPDVSMEQRSVAQRQMVSIARAVSRDCRVLILDEPTSSLSVRETEALFAVIRGLRENGVAIVYVSHRMDEIFELADRVAVLRDGSLVAVEQVVESTPQGLIQLMVGRAVEFEKRAPNELGPVRLEVRDLRSGPVRDVSFTVRAGEVVAMAGLVGAGRSETARAIFGLDSREAGEVLIDGTTLSEAIRQGVALLPEDRQHEGLHLPLSVRENLAMASRPSQTAVIDRRAEAEAAKELIGSLAVKTASDLVEVASLSGGNQQKVLFGKWLATQPKVLILDEPTRGVDVGAKDQIHRLIGKLAAEGVAILVISSELNEILALGDRILVMRQGRLAGELAGSEATQEKILELALPIESDETTLTKVGKEFPREIAVAGLLGALIIVATLANPTFLSLENLRDMLVKVAPTVIVGSMMTLVILAREIDISVGSLMGLCAATLGIAVSPDRMGLPVPIAISACIAIGALGGLLNGVIVAYAKLPSIIVTLGTLTLFKGATELAMGGRWIENLPASLRTLGTGGWIIPIAALSALVGMWISRRTRLGMRVFALGSNPHAAMLVGVKAARVQLLVFVLTGLACGVATLFSATQLQVMESGFGSGFELAVIAAVIVGGTSIRGGRGGVLGTVLGAGLLGIVSTVLIFLKLGPSAAYWEKAMQGVLILVAVVVDHIGRRKRS